MHRWLLAVLLVLLGLDFSAVTAEEDPTVFRIGVEGSVGTLDPHRASDPTEMSVAEACFEGLTFIDPETLQPVPGLAERWVVSKDRRTWRFTLRADAHWSDGRAVTAEHVAASFRRALHPAVQSPWAFMLFGIRGAREWHEYGEAAEAIARDLHDRSLVQHLRAFTASHPDGVSRAQWAQWEWQSKLPSLLLDAREPLVREAYLARRAHWSAKDLETLAAGLTDAARRLRAAHEGARASFGHTTGVVAEDPRTVRFNLTRPDPWFAHTLTLPACAPLPPEVIPQIVSRWDPRTGRRENPWWHRGTPVVSGPYRVVKYVPATKRAGSVVCLERNEKYRGAATIRQPVFEVIGLADGEEGLQRFVAGGLDWSQSWPPAMGKSLRTADTFHLRESNVAYYYVFRCDHPALKDGRVRHALAKAVDRRALLATAYRGLARPADTLVPAAMPGYTPPSTGLAFDPATARERLREAGYPQGRGLPEIVILFNKAEAHRKIAEFVAAQWTTHLGVKVTLKEEGWLSYLAARKAGAFVAARAGWISDTPDPLSFLELFASDSPNNAARWASPAYDALLAEAREAPVGPERLALLQRAEQALHVAAPCMPLYWYQAGDLVQPHVRGFRTRAKGASSEEPGAHNISGLHPLRGLWIERPPK